MRLSGLLAIVALVCTACDRPVVKSTPTTTPSSPSATPSTPTPRPTPLERTTTLKPVTPPDADNTAKNARDRDGDLKTPIDQNENQPDIDITAKIRQRVVDTKMSINAQNVKIITQDGKVTLRGPVKTEEEKTRIEEFAREVAGADKVASQLEVEKSE